jgi:hypothetical protein
LLLSQDNQCLGLVNPIGVIEPKGNKVMRIWVVQAKRGGCVGINCFDSREAAENYLNNYFAKGDVALRDMYEIIELYLVDKTTVQNWIKEAKSEV